MSIPIEEIAKFPPPGMSTPVMFAFSPDDHLLTYLYGEDQSPIRRLYALDTVTGESRVIQASVEPESRELSLEEQLLRQRQRQLGQGIVQILMGRRPRPDSHSGTVRCLRQGWGGLTRPSRHIQRRRPGAESNSVPRRLDDSLRQGRRGVRHLGGRRRAQADNIRRERHGQDARTRRVHSPGRDAPSYRLVVV